MTEDDIKRLKSLAEQATPGPWQVAMSGHSYHEVARVNGLEIAPPDSVELAHWTIDAAYIAATSPSVTLALLREIDRLQKAHDEKAAELASLQVAFNDWKVMHSTVRLEVENQRLRALLQQRGVRLPDGEFKNEIDAALSRKKEQKE